MRATDLHRAWPDAAATHGVSVAELARIASVASDAAHAERVRAEHSWWADALSVDDVDRAGLVPEILGAASAEDLDVLASTSRTLDYPAPAVVLCVPLSTVQAGLTPYEELVLAERLHELAPDAAAERGLARLSDHDEAALTAPRRSHLRILQTGTLL